MCAAFSGIARSAMNSMLGVSRRPVPAPTSRRDHALGALQRGGGAGTLLLRTEHGVEDRGVLQVTRDAHVGDGDENPSRGSLIRRSIVSATMTLIRSAILRARGWSVISSRPRVLLSRWAGPSRRAPEPRRRRGRARPQAGHAGPNGDQPRGFSRIS